MCVEYVSSVSQVFQVCVEYVKSRVCQVEGVSSVCQMFVEGFNYVLSVCQVCV